LSIGATIAALAAVFYIFSKIDALAIAFFFYAILAFAAPLDAQLSAITRRATPSAVFPIGLGIDAIPIAKDHAGDTAIEAGASETGASRGANLAACPTILIILAVVDAFSPAFDPFVPYAIGKLTGFLGHDGTIAALAIPARRTISCFSVGKPAILGRTVARAVIVIGTPRSKKKPQGQRKRD
jgi:hypothetical protein